MAKEKLDALVKVFLGLLFAALSVGGGLITHELTRIDRDIAAVRTVTDEHRGRIGLLENHEVGTSRDIGAQGASILDLKRAIEKIDERQREREASVGNRP